MKNAVKARSREVVKVLRCEVVKKYNCKLTTTNSPLPTSNS